VAVGEPHHIVQRGNNRQDVFFVDDDRRVYLSFLREQGARHGLRIHAYCLMTNHVHLVVVPEREESLARAIGRAHFRYCQYVNALHGRSGHLWQGRFYSCAMDHSHYAAAVRYVEQNPVRAGLAELAWDYPWSSAAVHCGHAADDGLLDMLAWCTFADSGAAWEAALRRGLDDEVVASIRRQTHTGRPLGSDSFLSMLEHILGRRVRALPVGRPRKTKPDRKPLKNR